MTQTVLDFLTIFQSFALIALYFGTAPAAIALAAWFYKRSQRRYHVGNPHSRRPVTSHRTRSAAVRASVDAYRETGRCHRITSTR